MLGIFLDLLLLTWAAMIAHIVWFMLGPARASKARVAQILARSTLPASLCATRYARARTVSPLMAFLLSYLFTPVVGYAYVGRGLLAALCAITFCGLGVWAVIGIFQVPYLALEYNERVANTIARNGDARTLGEHVHDGDATMKGAWRSFTGQAGAR